MRLIAPRETGERCVAALFVVLLVQAGADGQRVIWIDGALVKFHVLDFSFFIYDDSGAARPFEIVTLNIIFFQDAILDEDFAVHVAEQRHGDADLLGEGGVCGGTVYADSEDDGVTGFELGLISLIGLEFFGSATSESQDVEGENDVFLAAEIAQLDGLPVIAEKREIRGDVAHLQGRLGNGLVLRCGGELRRHQQQKQAGECQDASFHLRSFGRNQSCARIIQSAEELQERLSRYEERA